MQPEDNGRRVTVALLCALHAPIFTWTAIMLPWRRWTAFALITAALAALHAVTAVLSLIPSALARHAFRATALCSLVYLGILSYALGSSAIYVASLNRGLGGGVAAAMLTVWAAIALLTLPLACWGIASTGGIRWRRPDGIALVALAAVGVLGAAWKHRAAKAEIMPLPGGDTGRVGSILHEAAAPWSALPAAGDKAPSLFTKAPAACASPPSPDRITVVITQLARDEAATRPAPVTRCVQPGPEEDAVAALGAAIAKGLRGPIKIDVLSAVQPLGSPGPGLLGLALRPGLDGICLAGSCLMPWQLIAADAFSENTPLDGVPDLRFGVDLPRLRKALGETSPPDASADTEAQLRGLLRIETLSYVVHGDGSLHLLARIGQPGVALSAGAVQEAARAAERYIVSAQRKDGMFSYMVDPFSGRASFDGFSIARQAGTTLALCELGEVSSDDAGGGQEPPVKQSARRSLEMLAGLMRTAGADGSIGALVYPADSKATAAGLNPTALGLVAFVSCRALVGPQHDATIGKLARMVLATQREDGGFAPELDLATAAAIPGPGQLYEGGQSVLALTLLEAIAAREPKPELPDAATLKTAVDRAMAYYANDYWDHLAADFFYLEENWHCLAARAALGHHRRDDYERFCIDYVTFKSRLVLDEASGVLPDFIGGYGFGNVLPPHNTATAGFGEALAAAMALKEARGEDLTADKARMEKVLGFLVRQQWLGANCFPCSRNRRIDGAFSEHMASPRIRIDYVQHAWAALGHGGRLLGLVPGRSAPQAVPL